MTMKKITVVGAGHVGATTAQRIAEKELAREVVLVDILEGIPMGKGLDQTQSGPVEGFDSRVIGTNDYAAAKGSEVFVVTAGIPRKPGMSRDDLVKTNADIVKSVSQEIRKVAPKSIVIMVSNPLDVMSWVAKEVTGFPRERVMGMAGILDTARGHPGDGAGWSRRQHGAAHLVHHRLGHPGHAAHQARQAGRDR
jgi:malate dehydrogenase